MYEQETMLRLIENCDIYFENSLISKEMIIQKYADFLAASFFEKERSSCVTLHTGSVCFDVVSFIMTALACISMDQAEPDEIIASVNVGDLVLYKGVRHRWLGIEEKDNKQWMKLEQDAYKNSGATTTWVPFERNKHQIRLYNGVSDETDGKGERWKRTNRTDFISYITGENESDVPRTTGVSAVVVASRASFDRIQKGIKIAYDGKSISLLDIVTASYYTEGGGEYQFGSNPSKTDPVLKITGKVSVARELVLNKRGNRTACLMVMGSEPALKGSSELEDLLGRKSLKFTHISMNIDSINAEEYIKEENGATVFACTKEFLLQNSKPIMDENPLTSELDRQVENILNNEVTTVTVDGGCSWDTYKKIRNVLFAVRRFEWDEEQKKNFIIPAHSLLNLFVTAAFSLNTLEEAVAGGELHNGVSSPSERIKDLWALAEKFGSLDMQCAFVADALEELYKSILSVSPKYQALLKIVHTAYNEKIAIIVPKAYYADILIKKPLFSRENIYIITANRFDESQSYDKVIVLGDFSGKHFDALKCKSAPEIIVLLYECETYWFKAKKHKAAKFEKRLNLISGLTNDYDDDIEEEDINESTDDRFNEETLNLEEYIDSVGIFDVSKFVAGVSASSANAPQSEISAIGRFAGGEQILFSKFYRAVVYNPSNTKNPISETDVDRLTAGDRLVFTKRDDFTKNIVDSIFDALQTSGRLSEDVVDAAEKALWWKEVLRDYRQFHDFSYRELAKQLGGFGCTVQEQGVRQWLVADSHIVGPREEITLRQIAEMTQDPYLLSDTSAYFDACRTVRRQRKKILELIGKAIEDKLGGHQPPPESELRMVYDNVDNLSEILELETITFLKEEVFVPVNLINKPVADMEVV